MIIFDNLSSKEKESARKKITLLGKKSKRYYILVVLSAIIATLGLLINDSAVIIGAMLISPLIDPILNISYAIANGHSLSLKKSAQTLVNGISLSIIIAILITSFIPIYNLPEEIITRTNPSIINLFIALAAGSAAIYAIVKKENNTIPGIGISVSLMPPLSIIGIGIALKDHQIASGAGLLFFTNLVAIIFASTIFLFLFGFKPSSKNEKELVKKSVYISIILLFGLTFILTSTFINITSDEKISTHIKSILITQLEYFDKGELSSFSIRKTEHDKLIINAKILSDKDISAADLDSISNTLAQNLGKSVTLQVTIIPTITGGKTLTQEEIMEIEKKHTEPISPESSTSASLEKIETSTNTNPASKSASPSAQPI